jgi:enoyl-CoA hydratase
MADNTSFVRYEVKGHVATILIERPDRVNALSSSVMEDLISAVERADDDSEVRVVIMGGAQGKGFCVGRDLTETRQKDTQAGGPGRDSLQMRGTSRNLFEAVLECGKPTVAAIFGFTLGGGAELALACDVRIAADDLQFGFPEATLGLGANFASQMLPRIISMPAAYDLLYTARRVDATESLALGLVNQVVRTEELVAATNAWAERVARNAPLTTRRYKAMITRGRDLPLAAALRLDVGPNPYLSEDRVEGVAAWTEKRAPKWRGK